MSGVVSVITQVADIMGEIRQASDDQAVGVTGAGEAVAMMEGATGDNAALVTQTATASGAMMAHAQQLLDAVAAFSLAAPAQHRRGEGGVVEAALQLTHRDERAPH